MGYRIYIATRKLRQRFVKFRVKWSCKQSFQQRHFKIGCPRLVGRNERTHCKYKNSHQIFGHLINEIMFTLVDISTKGQLGHKCPPRCFIPRRKWKHNRNRYQEFRFGSLGRLCMKSASVLEIFFTKGGNHLVNEKMRPVGLDYSVCLPMWMD